MHVLLYYLPPQLFRCCAEQPPEQPGHELFLMLFMDLYAPNPIAAKNRTPTIIVGIIMLSPLLLRLGLFRILCHPS